MSVNYGSTPFAEQLAYFLGKDKLIPTQNWYDVQRELRDSGFMVAGAMKADLLTDIKGALEKAHREGTTLAQFRKDIHATAEKLGWTKGWENADNVKNKSYLAWRTRVVYETNLRASYQAGRWQQIQEAKKTRPYLIYKHSHAVLNPRETHLSYNGLVVPVDSAWVKTHYPPKGFGCKCTMFSLSEWEMNKLGKTVPDEPPPDTFYNWTNPTTGEVQKLPDGVMPGFDFVHGESVSAQIKAALERKVAKLPEEIGAQLQTTLDSLVTANTVTPVISQQQAVTEFLQLQEVENISSRLRNKELAASLGLTEAEHSMIHVYTALGYDDINRLLHSTLPAWKLEESGDVIKNAAEVLSQALAKLPNKKGLFVRRVTLPDAILAEYQEGKIVTEQAFTSATYGKKDIFETGKVRFKIFGKTGKQIDYYSVKEDEFEVLFDKGVRFKVKNREEKLFNDLKITEITLEEV